MSKTLSEHVAEFRAKYPKMVIGNQERHIEAAEKQLAGQAVEFAFFAKIESMGGKDAVVAVTKNQIMAVSKGIMPNAAVASVMLKDIPGITQKVTMLSSMITIKTFAGETTFKLNKDAAIFVTNTLNNMRG